MAKRFFKRAERCMKTIHSVDLSNFHTLSFYCLNEILFHTAENLALAMLVCEGNKISSKKHHIKLKEFKEKIVDKGVMESKHFKVYKGLLQDREAFGYDFKDFSRIKDFRPLLNATEDFYNGVGDHLRRRGKL